MGGSNGRNSADGGALAWELTSALVVLWRFSAFSEHAERKAARIAGAQDAADLQDAMRWETWNILCVDLQATTHLRMTLTLEPIPRFMLPVEAEACAVRRTIAVGWCQC